MDGWILCVRAYVMRNHNIIPTNNKTETQPRIPHEKTALRTVHTVGEGGVRVVLAKATPYPAAGLDDPNVCQPRRDAVSVT